MVPLREWKGVIYYASKSCALRGRPMDIFQVRVLDPFCCYTIEVRAALAPQPSLLVEDEVNVRAT